MPAILDAGYDLDFFDDDILVKLGSIDKDAIGFGQNRYRIVILPGVKSIQLAALRKLDQFVKNGGILIATRRLPDKVPGLMASEAENEEVKQIIERLFRGPKPLARFVENEKDRLSSALQSLLPPDMALEPKTSDIGFVHRKTKRADIYFVANTSNVKRRVLASFRVSGKSVEVWNPLTGEVMPVNAVSAGPDKTRISLDFEPYQS